MPLGCEHFVVQRQAWDVGEPECTPSPTTGLSAQQTSQKQSLCSTEALLLHGRGVQHLFLLPFSRATELNSQAIVTSLALLLSPSILLGWPPLLLVKGCFPGAPSLQGTQVAYGLWQAPGCRRHRFFVVWGPEATLALQIAMTDLPPRACPVPSAAPYPPSVQ